MHVFHDIDHTSSEMFHYSRTQFFLPFNQVIEVLTFDPPTHEVYPIFIWEYSVLFGNQRMSQFPSNSFQPHHFFLHPFVNCLPFINNSHGKLYVTLTSHHQSATTTTDSPGIYYFKTAQFQVLNILLNLVDWFYLSPNCLIQIYQSIETPVISCLNGLNTHECHPSLSSFDQLVSLESNIEQKICVEYLQLRLIIYSTLQTYHKMLDRVSLIGYHLPILKCSDFFKFNHRFQHQRRHFQVFVVFQSPNELIYYLYIEQFPTNVLRNVSLAES